MSDTPRVVVLLPVYNDWHAGLHVAAKVDEILTADTAARTIVLVDDGSSQALSAALGDTSEETTTVHILKLRRNLGHQRAIGVALAWVGANMPCDAVVIMDGDGEDEPADVPRLLKHWADVGRSTIVFAERTRRSEGIVFRISYLAFRIVHRVLTGLPVRVGNFSVVPYERVHALVTLPDLWSHYAAAVFISRLPFTSIPTIRGKRIAGRSTMNFASLVSHGLSAIAVFSEVVSVRVLMATLAGMSLTLIALLTVLAIRLFTDMAIPGWATFTTGLLLIVLIQCIMFSILFSFIVLSNRKSASVVLGRDFELFVDEFLKVPER